MVGAAAEGGVQIHRMQPRRALGLPGQGRLTRGAIGLLGSGLALVQADRLAIDDVGAGFSSLRHIVMTSPDVLKLDRSIVDGVAGDPVLRTLVRAMVDFAHGCGAKVVAEGVETGQDAAALLELEVDLGQGWYFGRPGPAASLDGGVPEPAPEPDPVPVPVHVPQQRRPTERAPRWTPWSGSRGRRRAETTSGSYPGV